jgi:hypothetical protein
MKKLILSLLLGVLTFSLSAQSTHLVTNTNNQGSGSLRAAISMLTDGDIIRFDPDSFLLNGSDTISITSQISTDKSFTLVGLYHGGDSLYISGDSNRLFHFHSSSGITLDSIILINGIHEFGGGAIHVENSDFLILKNSVLRNNHVLSTAEAIGGGILAYDCPLTIESSVISHNYSGFSGAGIYAYTDYLSESKQSKVRINNSIISDNYAENEGGGITNLSLATNNSSAITTINHSIISGNSTGGVGGGISIYVYADMSNFSTLEINESTISNNTATSVGGGVNVELAALDHGKAISKIKVNDSHFFNNSNSSSGSAITANIYNELPTGITSDSSAYNEISIYNSSFNSNTSFSSGSLGASAIYASSGAKSKAKTVINCTNSTISLNVSNQNSSGIYVDSYNENGDMSDSAHVNILNSTIYNNISTGAGNAVFLFSDNPMLTTKGSILFGEHTSININPEELQSLGFNIFSGLDSSASITSTDFINVDSSMLLLGEFMDNGGKTFTHLPDYGSIAIEAGDPNEISVTQNGRTLPIRSIGSASPEPIVECSEEIDFCPSVGYFSVYDWNETTTFNDVENNSGNNNGYLNVQSDENIAISSHLGGNISFSLTPGFSFWQFTLGWRIFVDWNNNGSFTDDGEIVYSGFGKSVLDGSFTIPENVTSGCYGVRVSNSWASYPNGCDNVFYGEVEDYTLVIANELSPAQKIQQTTNTSTPIAIDEFNFEFIAKNNFLTQGNNLQIVLRSRKKGNSLFYITDYLGRTIKTVSVNHLKEIQEIEIPTTDISSGVYFISNAESVDALKFVIQ